MVQWIKRGLVAVAAVVVVGGLIYALRPLPVPVDLAIVDRGPLEVTVDEEGVTRIREVNLVSAPVAGKVLRSPREAGDDVIANKTEVAVIRPVDPPLVGRTPGPGSNGTRPGGGSRSSRQGAA